ncbi:MAG: GAF domain-containing protein [Planctomycetota bacterium]
MASTAILNELLDRIAPSHRQAFRRDYEAIRHLPGAATDLQQFLDDFLDHCHRLYAATAGAIWFRGPDGDPLSMKSSVGIERLGLDNGHEQAHRELLGYAMSRNKAFVIKPYSAPAPNAGVSNPTDSFLVVAPIEGGGEQLGIVELFLGPTPRRGKTVEERDRYATWLDHLVRYLCQGVELRFLGSSAPLQPALVNLAATKSEIEGYKEAIRRSLEVTLNSYAGMSFGSLRNNQSFMRGVHELLEEHGLRIACAECGAASILRCQSAGNSKTGVFLYDHYLETGRTFHGGPSTFPSVKLVPKPPRRRAVE